MFEGRLRFGCWGLSETVIFMVGSRQGGSRSASQISKNGRYHRLTGFVIHTVHPSQISQIGRCYRLTVFVRRVGNLPNAPAFGVEGWWLFVPVIAVFEESFRVIWVIESPDLLVDGLEDPNKLSASRILHLFCVE